ncbi:MAG: hypothetical protein KTR32_21615 [Granulosicoccus sp.]|nr:hypothetical protein [Granulosicoccus sp.]
MSIEAINEQLLRSVGVGVALFEGQNLELAFYNEVFKTWFEEAEPNLEISSVFPTLDVPNMLGRVEADGRYATEISLRKKRRTVVVAQIFTTTTVGGQELLVLECQNITRIRELEAMIDSYSKMVERNAREIQREKEQVEKLLLNIMPRAAYEEFRDFGVVAPQRYESVSVLILEFINFSDIVAQLPPATLVSELNELYSAFDRIGEQLSCERIRTTGDSYRCVAGMQEPDVDHQLAVATAATRFIRYLNRRNNNATTKWHCRIGIGTGPVVGSVVGNQKYVYDIFGKAISNAIEARAMASEMEVLAWTSDTQELGNSLRLVAAEMEAARDAGLIAISET